MTEKRIIYALNRINKCKRDGYAIEALIRSYHLNVQLIRFILTQVAPDENYTGKKLKTLVKSLLEKSENIPQLRSLIQKRSIKSLKPWHEKMDAFFKSLKLSGSYKVNTLQLETDKIFGILKISANKLNLQ
jgi:hypothetical protein